MDSVDNICLRLLSCFHFIWDDSDGTKAEASLSAFSEGKLNGTCWSL